MHGIIIVRKNHQGLGSVKNLIKNYFLKTCKLSIVFRIPHQRWMLGVLRSLKNTANKQDSDREKIN